MTTLQKFCSPLAGMHRWGCTGLVPCTRSNSRRRPVRLQRMRPSVDSRLHFDSHDLRLSRRSGYFKCPSLCRVYVLEIIRWLRTRGEFFVKWEDSVTGQKYDGLCLLAHATTIKYCSIHKPGTSTTIPYMSNHMGIHICSTIYGYSYMSNHIWVFIYGHPYMIDHI